MTAVVSSKSTENIWVPVRSEHPINGAVDLTPYTVDVAFTRGDPASGDWKPATWEPTTKTITGEAWYLARVKIGPAGAIELDDGPWNVYVRVTTSDEQPVAQAGSIRIT